MCLLKQTFGISHWGVFLFFQFPICTCYCFPDLPLTVELTTVSETSLNFTWNEYQHCNNDDILIVYEYQLQRGYGYRPTYIYEGSETKTSISFDDLKPDTEYRCEVSVSVTSLLTGNSRYIYWGEATGKTTLVYGMLHDIYIFDFCG